MGGRALAIGAGNVNDTVTSVWLIVEFVKGYSRIQSGLVPFAAVALKGWSLVEEIVQCAVPNPR